MKRRYEEYEEDNMDYTEMLKTFVLLCLLPLIILSFFFILFEHINNFLFCNGMPSKVLIPTQMNHSILNIKIEYVYIGNKKCKGIKEYKSILSAEFSEIMSRKLQNDTISNLIKHKDRTIMEISNEITEPNIKILDVNIDN